jgi:hypothetical protein
MLGNLNNDLHREGSEKEVARRPILLRLSIKAGSGTHGGDEAAEIVLVTTGI